MHHKKIQSNNPDKYHMSVYAENATLDYVAKHQFKLLSW